MTERSGVETKRLKAQKNTWQITLINKSKRVQWGQEQPLSLMFEMRTDKVEARVLEIMLKQIMDEENLL